MSVKLFRNTFFSYFYLFFVFVGLTQMLGVNGGWSIIIYISLFLSFTILNSIDYKFVDVVVVFFALYSIGTYYINKDYPSELLVYSIRDQIAPMSFFFFARSKKTRDCCLLKNMVLPLMISYIIGLYLFFRMPGWYLDFKLNGDYNRTIGNYYNVTRMSSFWSSSYFVGYSALFVIMFYLTEYVFHKNKMKNFKLVMMISFLALFFAQQKVSIAFVSLFLAVTSFFAIKRGVIKRNTFLLFVFCFVFGCLIVVSIVLNYMDKDYVSFLIERYFEHDEGMVADRVGAYDAFISSISFWGGGLGRYSHNAASFNLPYIPDCEYIRTPNELGVFGMSIFIFIILMSYLFTYRNKNIISFESFCVSFFLIAMIGATPLEVSQQQPFMLWYCLGKMNNYGRC